MDLFQIYRTPADLDDMIMCSDGECLTGLSFIRGSEKTPYSEDSDLPVFRETVKWLDTYFSGKIPDLIPAYRVIGLTPFRKEVLEAVASIPYGQTMTYGDIAEKIAQRRGIPRMSAQAVGQAVGWNPLCIIIPCHRVIGANGDLTGYGGGLSNKTALLRLEGNDMSKFHLQDDDRII